MSTPPLTDVRVRDAEPADLPDVRRVLLAAYQEYATALPPAVFGRYLTDILDVEVRAGSGRVLVAEHGGRIVGTVTYYADAAAEGLGWPAGWAGLRALGVDPAARGAGLGRILTEECRRRALAAGAPVLCLHTAEIMTAAVALYERIGFRRDPVFDFDAASLHGLGGVRPVPVLSYRLDLSRHHHEEHTMEFPLAVRHDGRELDAGPGTRVQVPPGVAHDFWNASDEEVRVLVEVQPGERLGQLIHQLFLAAQPTRSAS